jgi:Yip1 domain
MSPEERAWWRRLALVLVRPRAVFAALRSTDEADEAARQEPVLLVIFVAGMAGVLLSPRWRELLDDSEIDGLSGAVVTFIGGGLYGAAGYFLLGGALHLGARAMGSTTRYRTVRHLLALAGVPLAISFAVVLPLALAAFGGDWFRSGGDDEGAGHEALLALGLAFVAWSAALVVVGLRETVGLPWRGVVGAVVLGTVLVAALAVLPTAL